MLKAVKESVTGTASKLFGLSQKEDSQASASGTPHSTQVPHATFTDADDDGDELHRLPGGEEIANPGTKRARDEDQSIGGGPKKRRRSNSTVNNLEPNFTTGQNPYPIPTPQPYNFQEEWRPQPAQPQATASSSMGTSHKNKGFVPMNTLGQTAPQSTQAAQQRTRTPFVHGYKDNPFRKAHGSAHGSFHPSLSTTSSRGSNVKRTRDFSDEGDRFAGSQASKRQNTGQNSPTTVDLTSDDASPGPPVYEVIGRARDAQASNPIQSTDLNKIFSERTSQAVDDALDVSRRKKRAKGGRSTSHSSKSKHTSPDLSQAGRSTSGSKQQPVYVDEEPIPDFTTMASAASKKSQSEVLPINLESGLEEAGQAHQKEAQARFRDNTQLKQGSQADINDVNAKLRQATQKKGPGNSQPQPPQSGKRRRIPQHTDNARGTPNMRDVFKRDDGSQARPQPQRAPERMQGVRSKFTSADASDGDDPLHGDTTVASPSARHSSLVKAAPTPLQVSSTINDARTNGSVTSPSPQGLVPEDVKHGTAPSRRGSDAAMSADEGPVRIPIKTISCKACSLSGSGLELVWSDPKGEFLVVDSNAQQPIHNPVDHAKPITFGAKEARLGWVENRNSCKVQLKGSATNTSQGLMVIEFDDLTGLSQCFEYLLAASGDKLKTHTLPFEKMENIFNRQLANDKIVQAKAQSRQDQTKPSRTHYAAQASNDDEIQYEVDPEELHERPKKAKNRMQGRLNDTMVNALREENHQQAQSARQVQGETSPYFDNPPRRSVRQSQSVQTKVKTPTPPRKWTAANKIEPWTHPVTLPGVTVEFKDLDRLDEGGLLNDSIVNFELRWIEQHMKPEHREKVHFFSSYFYSALTNKNDKKGFNYQAVERWTRKISLLEIPYVVVPINADTHWYLAIICNLNNLPRKCTAFDEYAIENGNTEIPINVDGDKTRESRPLNTTADKDQNELAAEDRDIYNFDVDGTVTGDAAVVKDPTTIPNGMKAKKARPLPKHDPKAPIIIAMDSLAQSRGTEMKFLKMYVAKEAEVKRGMDNVTLKAMTAKGLPTQPNYSDCGVYLCAYVAEFAKDPDGFVKRVLQREIDENDDFANFNPSAKRDEIRDRILETQRKQADDRKAHKKAKADAKKGQTPQPPKASNIAEASAPATEPPSSTLPALSSPTKSPLDQARTPSARRSTDRSGQGRGQADSGESDDLEVEAPLPLTAGAAGANQNSHDDDDMLDDPVDTNNDTYHNSHDDKRSPGLLDGLEAYANSATPAQPEPAAPQANASDERGMEDTSSSSSNNGDDESSQSFDDGDEAQEEPEVPDSQEGLAAADSLPF